jgi:indolepyruvate ferredoxin oxidoreductase
MTWPLDSIGVHEFAQGLDEIIVVEEKRQVLEYALKEELYNLPDGERPRVVGKFDDTGEWSIKNRSGRGDWLLPGTYELNPAQIARAIASRIGHYCAGHPVAQRVKERIAYLEAKEAVLKAIPVKANPETDRIPYLLLGLPAQQLDQGAGRLARAGRHRLPLHGAVDGPRDLDLHPHGRGRHDLDRPGPVHR